MGQPRRPVARSAGSRTVLTGLMQHRAADRRTIESVLVYVGGDLVGDGLMKLPFVRALRHAFPAARITWCAGKHDSVYAHALKPLVAGLIDEVIERAGFERPLRLLLRRPLDGRHFDLVIDTQRGVPATLLLRRVRHGRLVSGAADFLLSDVRPPKGYRRPESMVRQMLDLLAFAAGAPTVADAPLALADDAIRAAEAALPAGPVYVGIAPGAGGRHKCWPLDRFVVLARTQVEQGRRPVFILGPGEADWACRLRSAVPEALIPCSDPASGRAGSDDPVFTIAVGRRLAAAIANDAGVGHLLAAADVPLVSLFGPTRPEKFAPAARHLAVIDARAFGATEMTAIPVAAVAATLERMLGQDGAGCAGASARR